VKLEELQKDVPATGPARRSTLIRARAHDHWHLRFIILLMIVGFISDALHGSAEGSGGQISIV
jgi:hypothetical protein